MFSIVTWQNLYGPITSMKMMMMTRMAAAAAAALKIHMADMRHLLSTVLSAVNVLETSWYSVYSFCPVR